jgi:hypothetical protein
MATQAERMQERARAFRRAKRLNDAYARTLVGPDGALPSREAAQLVIAHWIELTKDLRAETERE